MSLPWYRPPIRPTDARASTATRVPGSASPLAFRLVVLSLPLVAALAVFACSEPTAGNIVSDSTPPTLSLEKLTSQVDSILAFNVDVKDNLGIKRIHLEATGGVTASFDTVFTSAVTQTDIPITFSVPRSVTPGTAVTVVGVAYDGAGNPSKADTLHLAVGNLAPGTAVLTSPASGTIVVQGKSIIVSISGTTPLKVASLGYRTSGSFTAADSTSLASPLRDSTAISDTLAVPAAAPVGSLVVTPFMRDSLGQLTLGTPITLQVRAPGTTSASAPTVNFGTTKRIEVSDTLHVDASDPNGITYVGYEIRVPNGAGTIPVNPSLADSVGFNGTIISVPKTFKLALPSSLISSFPQTIYVRAFARNAASPSVRGYALLSSGAVREDTLTVVAGVTRSLPFGGSVADALYHSGRDRLYLTNIDRDQVEVFNLADSSFKTAINVGSRPWGIAAWPRDTLGTMGDTLLVANSGGTDISYVDLTTSHEVSVIREQQFSGVAAPYRYALPNLVAYTVTTATSSAGVLMQQRTKYDFSDRPQYIGATCRGVGPACGDVILTYSTTPTPGQTVPFNQNNGTLRWEDLSRTTVDQSKSHFFFEQAMGQSAGRADTLEVERYDAVLRSIDPGYLVDLVPASQPVNRPSSDPTPRTYSVVVVIGDLGFRDTTYVRNSGNFRRAVFGEGGPILNSRAMTYDASYGFQTVDPDFNDPSYTLTTPVVDLGVSGAFNISNFIANDAQRVSGVAMNFDGSLAAIRGDSTYIINHNLTLQGLLPTSAANSGLDFHPQNSGLNAPLASRLIFTASADANLEVWDTGCYQRVATVPIRDPIVGPIKAAVRSVNGKLIIFGVTARGVVIVTLPNNFQSSCS